MTKEEKSKGKSAMGYPIFLFEDSCNLQLPRDVNSRILGKATVDILDLGCVLLASPVLECIYSTNEISSVPYFTAPVPSNTTLTFTYAVLVSSVPSFGGVRFHLWML